MRANMWAMSLGQFLYALFFTVFFSRYACMQKRCGGVRFGLWIGLILGACSLGAYAYMPLPSMQIPMMWFLAEVLRAGGTGAVLGLVFCEKSNCQA